MKYRFSILNIPAFLFLLIGGIFTAIKYNDLSKDEGWGIVGMISLFACAIFALLVDLLIQRLITSKTNRIKLSVLVLITILGFLFLN